MEFSHIMDSPGIQDLLPLVERPSRYLGSEINSIQKDLRRVRLSIALAFPDLYEIGTSHFGMQILYHVLNQQEEIAAERVFAPAPDMQAYLRADKYPLVSLENHRPLNTFDIVGFSLLYELNYTNVMAMLDLAGIPFYAEKRDVDAPMIIAGGPCTSNPEPVADFFDAMVIGDAETVILEMAQAWIEWKTGGRTFKEDLLNKWSQIEGVYIPSLFRPRYNAGGFQSLEALVPSYSKVQRAIVSDLNEASFPDVPIVPFGKPIHDRLRLEISRGCTRGCRFCQAGMIYRPVRERSLKTLLSLTQKALAATGYEDLSLLSLSTGDYSEIIPLMEQIMACCEHQLVAISLPSLRAGSLTPELMTLVKKVRKTGFTIAPEAGSQRLRNVINKNVSKEDIINTVRDAFQLGWKVIKLYFMVGLPTETERDLKALIDFVKELRRVKGPQGRGGKINVSVATFIPKSHTPFQWVPQNALAQSREKIDYIKKNLRLSGVQVKWQNPQVSILEGLWARGDRRLSRLLLEAYRQGCQFDGWSDHFNFSLWGEALAAADVRADFYTTRKRDLAEPLPWDHIDTKVTKAFLADEWQKAIQGLSTPDCRQGDCCSCGVCDFKQIAPKTYGSACLPPALKIKTAQRQALPARRVEISYSKRGQARFFGHLELVKILLRALKRAGISLVFTQGFHPKPKIGFEDPLPIGIESVQEYFYLTLLPEVSWKNLAGAINAKLPDGLKVLGCQPATVPKNGSDRANISDYQIKIKDGFFDPDKLKCFEKRSEVMVIQARHKGKPRQIDLKSVVLKIGLLDPERLTLRLCSKPGKTVRPGEIVREIFGLSPTALKKAQILRTGFQREGIEY